MSIRESSKGLVLVCTFHSYYHACHDLLRICSLMLKSYGVSKGDLEFPSLPPAEPAAAELFLDFLSLVSP